MNIDEKYIKICFELAKKSLGLTSPNPIVGAVLVKNNSIIGMGYHKKYGFPHAEVEAINDAIKKGNKSKIKGSILYVNLEPCYHWGKTPPCVDKIIEYNIKKVVCSIYDPNPKVRGKSVKKLIQNGIECMVGILKDEAKNLNKFYIKWITKKLPYITVKSAVSLDGKIATKRGDSKWISSKKSRNYVYKLRSVYDAVLVGINTILKDNPTLTSHGYGRDPVRIVVGNINKLSYNFYKYKIFTDSNPTIFFTPKFGFIYKKLKDLNNIKIFKIEDKNILDFEKILETTAQLGITSILVEGGGETIWHLFDKNLVDDFILFIAPKIFGGRYAKTFVEGEGVKYVSEAFKAKIENVEFIDKDLVVKGYIL